MLKTGNLLKIGLNLTRIVNESQRRSIKRWVAPTLRELQCRKEKLGVQKEDARSSYLEWNYEAELFAFGKRLGENFKEDLLKTALTHRSYAIDKEEIEGVKLNDNREMIENGREIISDFLTREFKKDFPDIIVTSLKNYLTSEKILGLVSLHIGLKDIILSKDFPVEEKILADTFPAIISALKLSSGLETAEKFIRDFLIVQLNGKELFDIWKLDDSFNFLKRELKDKEIEARLCNQSGVNTILANYQVGLYSDKKLLGIGFGETIEVAKNTAALDVLSKIYARKKVSLVEFKKLG